jgi:hypothetical protein
MGNSSDDVEQESKDEKPHVTFDLGNNVYIGGSVVDSTDPVTSESSFDSVDLAGEGSL